MGEAADSAYRHDGALSGDGEFETWEAVDTEPVASGSARQLRVRLTSPQLSPSADARNHLSNFFERLE